MADNLIFPIGFDLEKAVNEAGQQWDKKYAKKLEDYIAKRPVRVKLDFEKLDDVKRRLAELKIEPLTPENKTAIKDLVRELKELAKAMEKVQKYSKIQTPELQQALANKANAEAAHMAEKYRQANERLEVSKRRVALAEQKHAEALSNTSKKINEQHSYVSRLIKRMAVYASFSYAGNFLTSVREVTAQFELQRVSLGAIIQDQTRANALFSEIKAFALKSPVSILDLTKYTKQIAAYRIETEKLFDTTKMLTDISVGLGVDLQRITLFFGQVRARGALFSSEIRQATEAGIPLVELLAKKYSELNGQLVTASQVLKMVEKGMVGFEMVEEIFKDMTSAGGMFYEMQEKQGNTLYGLWAKLGDAAAVMYDEIGNTESVNKGMKSAIQALTDLMKSWRDVARIATEAGITFAVYRLAVIASTKATALATVWEKKDIVLRQMHLKTVMAQSMYVRNFNRVLLASGVSAQKASTATWVFSRALHGLKAAIATTGIGALIIGLALLVDKLLFSKSAAEQLKESLDNIETESVQEQDKSVRNFERLANIAVSASSTYKEQQAALDELKRTYKEIIPQEQLTIENLKQMNGNYELLTASIRKYVAERMKQKQTDEIINTYAYEILKIQRKVNNELKNKYSYEQLAAFWEKYTEIVKDASKSAGKSVSELVDMTVAAMGADRQFAHDIGSRWSWFQAGFLDMPVVTRLIREQERQIDALSKTYDSAAMAMGEYAKSYNEAVDKITENGVKLNGAVIEQEDNPLLYFQQKANLEVKDAMIPTIKEAFNAAGIAFNDGWTSLRENVDENMPQLTSSINFDPMVEKANEESQKLLAELQKQLDALVAQRIAYDKQIKAEESKGKGGNDEVIQAAKTRYNEIGDEIEKLEERARKINILPQLLEHLKKKYEDLAPSDSVVKLMRQRFDSIVDYTKDYAKNMRRFRMNADEDMEAYRKRLSDEVELIKKNIKAWTAAMVLARLFRNKTEEQNLQNLIDEAKLQLADLEKILGDMPEFEKGRGSGRQSDPRLQNLKEEISLTKKLYDEYHKLEKQIGATKAAEKIQEIYKNTISTLEGRAKKYGFEFELPFTDENLKANMQHFIDKMKELQGLKDKKGKPLFPNIGKEIDEAVAQLEDVDLNSLQKALEKKLKDLADRISRTKTAKEFYEKILSQTGDVELATRVSLSIYGSTGEELFEDTVAQIREVFKSGKEDVEIVLEPVFDMTNQRIDYKMLADIYEKYQNDIIDKNRDTAKKIAQEGQKTTASNIANWQKELAKAQGYEEQRTAIIQRESEKRANIIKDARDPEERNRLVSLSYDKQAQDLAKLAVDEFKSSDDYIKVFQDLDRVSTQTLDRMKKRLQEMIATVKDTENVDGLKSLVEQLDKISAERETRNPIEGLVNSFKKYAQARKAARTAEAEEAKVKAEFAQQEVGLNRDIQTAKVNQAMAQQRVTDLEARGLQHTNEYVAAQLALKNAEDKVTQAKERRRKAVKSVEAAEQDTTDATDEMKDAMYNMQKSGQVIVDKFKAAASAIQTIADMMGVAEDSELGDIVNGLVSGLNNAATIMSAILTLAIAIQSACWWLLAIGAAVAAFTAIGSWISNSKVRKANKEIERQQELLDQLEYAYGRLEKAADKVFGADFVANMNQQQKVLQAQAAAYQKQYEAELSKGKKADEEKLKEYQEAYRDTLDEIADMQGKFAERMAGTDVASAARDFAQAWLEAYASFGDTVGAIKEKFNDLIKNMIVESVMAKTVQMALQPMFDRMDEMYKSGKSMTDVLNYAFSQAAYTSQAVSDGLEVNAHLLESLGFNVRDLYATSDNLTGISRDIATASEKDINGLAAHMSTVEYYASTVPGMASDVAAIRVLLEGGAARTTAQDGAFSPIDYTPMFSVANQHLQSLPRIEEQLGQIYTLLNRVMVTKGGKFGINSFYN